MVPTDHPVPKLLKVAACMYNVRIHVVSTKGLVVLGWGWSHIPRAHYILAYLLDTMLLMQTSILRFLRYTNVTNVIVRIEGFS
jgi:hypothetical protein